MMVGRYNPDMDQVDQQDQGERLSRDDVGREIDRIQTERDLVWTFQQLFRSENPVDDRYQQDQFLARLANFTHNWQVMSGGTMGEVFARWVGAGDLTDFPVFTSADETEAHESIEITAAQEGKMRVRATVPFTDAQQTYVASYEFLVFPKELDKKSEGLLKKKREYQKMYNSLM
jgi:hypothetical protein